MSVRLELDEELIRRVDRLVGSAERADFVREAVAAGDYASSSEVIRAALRDWKTKRALQLEELAALKADIDKGLADVAAGRVRDFDETRIVERGRALLANRSASV